jgi:hypothetical protein
MPGDTTKEGTIEGKKPTVFDLGVKMPATKSPPTVIPILHRSVDPDRNRDLKENLVSLVHPDYLVQTEKTATLVAHPDLREPKVTLANGVNLAQMEKWVHKGNPDQWARLAHLVSKVCKDHPDFLAFLVNLADQVKLDNRDHRVHEVKLAHKGYQATLVKPVYRESLDKKVQWVLKVNKVTLDLLEQWA